MARVSRGHACDTDETEDSDMQTKARKLICAGMSVLLLALCPSCSLGSKELAIKMFKSRDKICYSSGYTELKETKRNSEQAWRDGMFSGNGEQGFITSGAPYSDSIIFQNAQFVMPADAAQPQPDDGQATMDEVRQALLNGEKIAAGTPDAGRYELHPGGALRINAEKLKAKKYIRYTDYETGEVGETFTDANGTWERKSFTSFADNVIITDISSASGARTSLTLSFDDVSTVAGFGDGCETDARVRRIVNETGSYLAFLGHYPDYEDSPLRNSGWLTLVYVSAEGGDTQTVELEKNEKTTQDVSEANSGIQITNAYAVRLISLSERVDDLGDMESFLSADSFPCVRDAARRARAITRKYQTDGFFDYDKALKAHTDIFTTRFNAVSLTLGEVSAFNDNESLRRAQKDGKTLDPAFALRAYYAGRYAALCCGGAMRGAGMFTGEFCPGRCGGYDLGAGAALGAAALNAVGDSDAVFDYARFLLRQAPSWAENAKQTHGFRHALQAPLYAEGDAGTELFAVNTDASRWWNAGTAMLLYPLYAAVSLDGNLELPIPEDFDFEPLRTVLSKTEKPLSEDACEEMRARGSLRLREDVLLPLLLRAANYWTQLVSPAYYTDAAGNAQHDPDKKTLSEDESYCLLPGFAPGEPAGDAHASFGDGCVTANAAVDIAACSETLHMLLDVAGEYMPEEEAEAEEEEEEADEEEEATDDDGDDGDDSALILELNACRRLLARIPAYRNDNKGKLEPWKTASAGNGDTLHSALACAWPFSLTRGNQAL